MNLSLRIPGLAMLTAFVLLPAASKASPEGQALDRIIDRELHAGGSFFTAPERALIERKCGYAPGSWDGFSINISNNVLTCSNGRRVDDTEVRAMLRTAEPRIEARVEEVMSRPAVRAAINRVAETATAEAMREIRAHRGD